MPKTKAEWRREMRRRLRALAPEEQALASAAICRAVALHPAFARAQVVALFASLPTEPALEELRTLAPRRFAYPRMAGEELQLVEPGARGELIAEARYGLREPRPGPEVVPDLILVPGLAFTRGGLRLGRGGGFYDRLLARLPPHVARLGICFACQLTDSLPVEAHDEPLHGVISEEGAAP